MQRLYDPTSVPQLISLAVNKDLLVKAKKLNINLSKELEKIIVAELEQAAKKQWTEKNLPILQALNQAT